MNPSRRTFLILGAGTFVVAGFPLLRGTRRRLVRRQVPVMGTIADLAVVTENAPSAQAAIDAALRELAFVDATMTRFRADSDVGRLNGGAGAVEVNPATAFVVARALQWAEATDGAFDPCLGRLAELWDVTHRHAPPPAEAWARLAGRRLFTEVDLDGHRVIVRDRDVALDLGGIAKGHGVDRAVEALRARGITDALVNVGGDLYALGRSEDGDPWRIGVRSAADPSRLTCTLDVEDEAVATSGDYFQGFDYAGRHYHHLLDPTTGAPRVTDRHSLTIRAADCLAADAAATALFGMDPEAAEAVARRQSVRVVPA